MHDFDLAESPWRIRSRIFITKKRLLVEIAVMGHNRPCALRFPISPALLPPHHCETPSGILASARPLERRGMYASTYPPTSSSLSLSLARSTRFSSFSLFIYSPACATHALERVGKRPQNCIPSERRCADYRRRTARKRKTVRDKTDII